MRKASGQMHLRDARQVLLASFNAVLTERAFKSAPDEPIWVNQTQLQLTALPVRRGSWSAPCGAERGRAEGSSGAAGALGRAEDRGAASLPAA